jgi:hypothetical protein
VLASHKKSLNPYPEKDLSLEMKQKLIDPIMTQAVEILQQKFQSGVAVPFGATLCERALEDLFRANGMRWRNRLFTPVVTLWASVLQVLDADKSERNAVSRIMAWLAASGAAVPEGDTGAYNRSKGRFSEVVVQQVFRRSGAALEAQVEERDLWCGRRVKLLDGSTVSMPDTPENQQDYPQQSTQQPGCGFPTARLLTVFSLHSGGLTDLAIANLNTSELAMARPLYRHFDSGDVAVADQFYGTYTDLVYVQQQQADAVFRRHYCRKSNFQQGRVLSADEHIVVWDKPKSCPMSLTQAEYDALPDQLEVREVRYQVNRPGWRVSEIVLVTTLLDAETYSAAALADLYQLRWTVELDLRHVKTTLNMEVFRAKTPERIRQELYIHALAYNLLRTVMLQAAHQAQVRIGQLSLQQTRQHLRNFIHALAEGTLRKRTNLYRQFLSFVSHPLLPVRPHRFEPRVRKRRPKAFPVMSKPRHQYKQSA